MKNFIELNDVNGQCRLVNVNSIAFVEKRTDNCRVVLNITGRGEYANFAFLVKESYDEIMAMLNK